MFAGVGLSAPIDSAGGRGVAAAGYARSISTISPGSLSGAYRAMKALQGADDPGSVSVRAVIVADPPAASTQTAILSAQGIPAALAAYGEVMDDVA